MQYMIYEIITKTIKHSTLLQNHPHLVNISKNLLLFKKLTLWKWTFVRSMRSLRKLMVPICNWNWNWWHNGETLPINTLVNLKNFYVQMQFQHLMLTVHCMGKLWAAIVYCIWNVWQCSAVYCVCDCTWTVWRCMYSA